MEKFYFSEQGTVLVACCFLKTNRKQVCAAQSCLTCFLEYARGTLQSAASLKGLEETICEKDTLQAEL